MTKPVQILTLLLVFGTMGRSEEAKGIYDLAGVWQADFNADSSRIITRMRGGKLGLWDASTGKMVTSALSSADSVTDYVLDERMVLALIELKPGSWQAFELLSGESASPVLNVPGTNIKGAFSPKGSMIYTRNTEGDVMVFETTSGKQLAKLKLPPEEEGHELDSAPQFFPKRHLVFLMDTNGRLHRYDTRTWKEVLPSLDHRLSDSAYVIGFNLSEDGQYAATFDAPGENGPDGSLQIWDLNTAKPVGEPVVGQNGISATFLNDSRCLLKYCWDPVEVVNLPSLTTDFKIRGQKDGEGSFARLVSGDNRRYILSWGYDSALFLSHFDNGTHAGNASLPCAVDSVLSPNSKDHIWITLDNTVHIKKQHYDQYVVKYSLPGLQPDAVLRVHDYIHRAVLSPSFKSLILVRGTTDHEQVRLFDAQTFEETRFDLPR